MIIIQTTPEQREEARKDAKLMGVLRDSFSKGRGNGPGNMGELLVHAHIKGTRCGNSSYTHDIEMENGLRVDVKTTIAAAPPEMHYVARVYGPEKNKEKLSSKCDVYYFVRCNTALTLATIVGWLPAREFIEKAMFTPKGHVNPEDGKLTFSDEFSLHISELIAPSVRITKKRLKGCG
jgi:hypothetical protein